MARAGALRCGSPPTTLRPAGSPRTHFAALVRSITYQQLAGAAAGAIHGRLIALLDGEVTPERILAATTEQLRAVGMSGPMTLSLHDLSAQVLDGTVVLDPWRLARLGDEEIVARLSAVRGIGKWSAEVFLRPRCARAGRVARDRRPGGR